MSKPTLDTGKPAMPELHNAPSVKDLFAMQRQSRALAIIYGLGIFTLALGTIALFVMGIQTGLSHPETLTDPGFIVGLTIPAACGLIGGIWLWAAMCDRWERHSPVKAESWSSINAVRDSYYIKLYSRSVEEVERYRSDVILMDREFTQHDLQVLDDYRDQITAYNWSVESWEREQSERRRLYGDQVDADAATRAVLGRLRKG